MWKLLVVLTAFVVYVEGGSKANITYTLWVNDNVTEIYNILLKVKEDTTFYNVMEIASGLNSFYEFKASVHPIYGHYVYEIAQHAEKSADSIYWMIYVLDHLPNTENPPNDTSLSDYGVDTLKVQDGKHYLFWYRTYIYEGSEAQ